MEGTTTRSGKIRGTGTKPGGTKKHGAVPTFVNEDAVARHEVMLKRTMLPDRGFVQVSFEAQAYDPYIVNIIEAHGWSKFCLQEPEAIIPVVREFYANMQKGKSTKVQVRGRSVSFSAATLRRVYELPTVEDEYQNLKNSTDEGFLTEVLTDLCVEGTEWKESTQKNLTFMRNALKPEARVWYHFLKSKLKPTANTEIVIKERAILLACILDGRPIDVGRVVQDEIIACGKLDSGCLWFPGMITRLCKEAGVPVTDDEERLHNTEPITPYTTERISKKAREYAGEVTPTSKPKKNAAASSTATAVDTGSTWQSGINQRLEKLETDQLETRRIIMEKLAEMDKFILGQLGVFASGPEHAAANDDAEQTEEKMDEGDEEKMEETEGEIADDAEEKEEDGNDSG